MQIYLVGGAVRDHLLGLAVKDRDWLVLGSTPEELIKKGFLPVGEDFPVFLHPKSKEEYALARTERKSGRGYHGFQCYFAPDVSVEEDLKRRDLTINAMAMTESGTLIDPYDGQQDLQQRVLRHVSDAFVEDPIRVLRIARFQARFARLGFCIAQETQILITQMRDSGELKHLVAERVWQETARALSEQSPMSYFNVLQEHHVLSIVLPIFADVQLNIEGLERMVQYTQEPIMRWVALLSAASTEQCTAMQQLSKHCRVPKKYIILTTAVIQHRAAFQTLLSLDASAWLALFESLGAFRNGIHFEQCLSVCMVLDQPTADWQLCRSRANRCLTAAQAVQIDHSHLEGAAIGQAIHAARLKSIQSVLSQ